MGEGAGIVFLETPESAQARSAKIFGEILGYAYGSDSFDPLHFNPKDDTLARTLTQLLHKTEIQIKDIDYINLHGTGTRLGDLYETEQLKHALGKMAYKISMSSTKSMTGHMLGASGAVEIIASLVGMQDEFIPPTINLEHSDSACDLDYVPRQSRQAKIKTAISLSLGFGGHVALMALRKV